MPVITIRGKMGSGAPEIGRMVAGKLNIDYVDREIIAKVAAELNYPEQQIEKQELPPAGVFNRIKNTLENSYPPLPDSGGLHPALMYLPPSQTPLNDVDYLRGLESVIKGLAAGNAIVIRGRGSQFILDGFPGAVHVLTVAPLETRIKHVMSSTNTDRESALLTIENFDKSRREFIKKYFKAELEDPLNYDLTINTGHISYDTAVDMIIKAVAFKDTAGS